ncbi:PAP/fibrillin family protein [Acaryochloris sp. 'Moss Beach']|uniref:PAP/fibrillin family protein n=1 Tax=Acaryochloris sp. 'Moss Beach' TaxID=2740837 RepID=UPI001F16D12B|nr:PAP/fibrillin family protein [Acaryochloris sp. 'Moss Beach']UJB68955.1 PAP/fibrillin family protein [Acaryochloris sp. 'Moss Beach']
MIVKAELLAAIAGTNRGVITTEANRSLVLDKVVQLEVQNPTPQPLSEQELLSGVWRLIYTTSPDLLGLARLPVVPAGPIYQCIRGQELKLYNVLELQGIPFLEGVLCVAARLTPVSERRVQVNFERSILGVKGLMNYPSLDVLISRLETQSPVAALSMPLDADRSAGWLETTYLDEDLRIGRGNNDSLFVLTRV